MHSRSSHTRVQNHFQAVTIVKMYVCRWYDLGLLAPRMPCFFDLSNVLALEVASYRSFSECKIIRQPSSLQKDIVNVSRKGGSGCERSVDFEVGAIILLFRICQRLVFFSVLT